MAGVRAYEFIVGPETSTLPTVSSPSTTDDIMTKGYADTTYTPRAHVYGKVSDVTALKAIGSSSRFDEQVIWVSSATTFYEFDSGSSATGDDDLIVQPTSGTGRWIKQFATAVSGSSGASGIESLEQKLEAEHYGINTDDLDFSAGSSFNASATTVSGVLLDAYTNPATAVSIVWNPVYLSSSDKNTDATTSWSIQGAAASLTTSATKKIGTASLSFNKDNSAGNARIRFDTGALSFGINGFTELFFWINLPSITNLTNVEVRVDTDGTNYQTFTATTDHTGAALATGWQLMKFDLSTGGSASGTGWDKSKVFRYLHIGVNTSPTTQTYTAILIDAIHFSIYNPSELIQVGNKYSIYDTSNVDSFTIDSASARVSGTIALASAITNSYTGGTGGAGAVSVRNTVTIAGDNRANMALGLSGNVAKTQVVRLQKVVSESLAGQNFKSMIDVNTNMFFKVLTVPGSTQITVEDLVDSSANLVSGVVLHVFSTKFNADGKKNFAYRELDLTITSSSYSSSVTTINTGTNTGIAVGDYVVVKHATSKISIVASTANESFVTATPDVVLLNDIGIPYPYSANVFAHWPLSGASGTTNIKGTGPNLVTVGSPTTTNVFKNGQYAYANLSTSNYLTGATAETKPISGLTSDASKVVISYWLYATAFTGTSRYIVSRSNSAGSAGWDTHLESGANNFVLTGGGVTLTAVAFTPNQWNHFVCLIDSGTASGSKVWLNATLQTSGTLTVTDPTNLFTVGVLSTPSNGATGCQVADIVIWRNVSLSQAQIESMYNRGLHRVLGSRPMVKYRYANNGLTGQKISFEGTLTRTTDAALVYSGKAGIIKG